jgi:tRNA threonylcarbamoyladenosine biosynthesis protein TsaB
MALTEDETIFALDTSHPKGSVAAVRGAAVLSEIVFDASDTHSATLMPAVDRCMRSAKLTLEMIDLFAVVTGPGSFTGLRIGMATVKALAAVHRRPVAPARSLEVLAAAFPFSERPVLVLIDARRGEVYAGLYSTADGTPVELVPPFSAEPVRAVERALAPAKGSSLVLCGSGVGRYSDIISAVIPPGSAIAPPRWAIPSASLLAGLSHARARVPYEDLHALEPLYIRPPDARLPASAKLRTGGGSRG